MSACSLPPPVKCFHKLTVKHARLRSLTHNLFVSSPVLFPSLKTLFRLSVGASPFAYTPFPNDRDISFMAPPPYEESFLFASVLQSKHQPFFGPRCYSPFFFPTSPLRDKFQRRTPVLPLNNLPASAFPRHGLYVTPTLRRQRIFPLSIRRTSMGRLCSCLFRRLFFRLDQWLLAGPKSDKKLKLLPCPPVHLQSGNPFCRYGQSSQIYVYSPLYDLQIFIPRSKVGNLSTVLFMCSLGFFSPLELGKVTGSPSSSTRFFFFSNFEVKLFPISACKNPHEWKSHVFFHLRWPFSFPSMSSVQETLSCASRRPVCPRVPFTLLHVPSHKGLAIAAVRNSIPPSEAPRRSGMSLLTVNCGDEGFPVFRMLDSMARVFSPSPPRLDVFRYA